MRTTRACGIIAAVPPNRQRPQRIARPLQRWKRGVRAAVGFVFCAAAAGVIGDKAVKVWSDVSHAAVVDRSTNSGLPSIPCVGASAGGGANTHGGAVVDVDLRVALPNECVWSSDRSPLVPRQTVNFLLTYRNSGTKLQRDVGAWINLPPDAELVPKSTMIYNSNNPGGIEAGTEAISSKGILIGSYAPGAVAYVKFTVVLPSGSLKCGESTLRTVGSVRPDGLNQYYNTATVTVYKGC